MTHRPTSEQELADIITAARGPLSIKGGGTRPIGRPVSGEALETGAISGVVDYEPGALTLVARAGTPVSEIEALLDTENQMLAFEPMDHRTVLGTTGNPTLGGVAATNASGPRRFSVGAARDFMLGVRYVDGAGQIVKNGGRVMKNVTGYDLVKLMAGSWGTLGVMTELSLKVLPKPEASATLTFQGDQWQDAMKRAVKSPYDVTGAAANPHDRTVHLRVEGFDAQVSYRARQLTEMIGPLGDVSVETDAKKNAALWAGIRDVADLRDRPLVWRVAMAASDLTGAFAHALAQLAEVDLRYDLGGGLGWIGSTTDDPAALHSKLQQLAADPAITGRHGGHVTLVKGPMDLRGSAPSFQPSAPAVAALMSGLRAKFDPSGILNPGLMT